MYHLSTKLTLLLDVYNASYKMGTIIFSWEISKRLNVVAMLWICYFLWCCLRGFLYCPHFFSFFFLCSTAVISITLSSRTLSHFFCLIYSAIDSFNCGFYFSYCILQLWLFFIFSNSLLKTSCAFSLWASILFLSSWIIFMIITLNSFLG